MAPVAFRQLPVCYQRFSALLVGLFIDGGLGMGMGMGMGLVSVPSWLGCSLMDGVKV